MSVLNISIALIVVKGLRVNLKPFASQRTYVHGLAYAVKRTGSRYYNKMQECVLKIEVE